MEKNLTRDQVVQLIVELTRTEGTQAAAAAKIGVSPSHIGDIIDGSRDPGPSVLDYFGIQKVISYQKK